MKKMNIPFNEYFLHYVWKTKQLQIGDLRTTDGQNLEILHFGHHNQDAGPDFLNAVIKIGETVWAGNVEIHVLSSDWEKHKHQEDHAYQNVILHVVYFHDKEINNGEYNIPCLSLHNKIPKILIQRFQNLNKSHHNLPCRDVIGQVDPSVFELWKHGLLVERLQNKEVRIFEMLEKYKYDWEYCFFITLSRYFGGTVNGIPFESLAQRIPIKLIRKNAHDKMVIQSLFFGQAGMLQDHCPDKYFMELKNIYGFLQKKYSLQPLHPIIWKFAKMRPQNFPTIRIAQLSTLENPGQSLFSSLLESPHIKDTYNFLNVNPDTYWDNHYRFGYVSSPNPKNLSLKFKNILMINAFLPMAFAYAKVYGQTFRREWVLEKYDQISEEINHVTTSWKTLGFHAKSALESQAQMELTSNYCLKKLCLSCKIGHEILCQKAK